MQHKVFTSFTALCLVCLLLAACGKAPTATPQPTATPALPTTLIPTEAVATSGILTIGVGWQDNLVRNFNPFNSQSIWDARYLIYEPLMVYNLATAEFVPWLATAYEWGVDNKTLTFTLRKGVRWSDGESFSSADVVATFKMLMAHPDITGYPDYSYPLSVWLKAHVADIASPDAFTVVFRFEDVDTRAVYKLAKEVIVPKHLWDGIDRPQDFANPNPVGTGPFTQVTLFGNRGAEIENIVQIERNPYYWQPGMPSIQGVRFSFRHDENTLADLTQGKLDWAFIQFADIHKEFLDLDPAHFQALVETYNINLLQLNTARPPFDTPDVRKAISMAIDRQHIVDTVFQGAVGPANAVGLSARYRTWWNEAAIRLSAWVGFDVSQANALLDGLGFKKGSDGVRITPGGQPMRYTFIADASDPQQAAVAQAISLDLANIGVAVTVKSIDNWWDTFQSDDYDMTLLYGGFGMGDTPYEFYFNLMSPAGVPITGAKNNQDAGRYTSPKATALLEDFIHVSDPLRQKEIMSQVEQIFVQDAPAIPLYPSFMFDEYNTLRFTGFPSAGETFVSGLPWNILVLLAIRSR